MALQEYPITAFIGGLNVTKPPTDIDDDQSPDCENIVNNELYGINSRYGYSRYYTTALATANVNALSVYNSFSSSDFIYPMGTSLKIDLAGSATTIYSGMVSGKVRSFEMNGYIYFQDGSGYIEYNGATASTVSGYIPTYYADKNPDGTGGGQIDELNYIQSAFKETFSGNATGTTFYMSFGSLTTGDNVVLVDNATLTSGAATAGFNVNYASGYFTLTTAASSGIGNVEITTHKPVLSSTCITNCTFSETYGEGNDTNAYLSGNSSFPARIFWCDAVQGATYFPATSYADVGVQNDKMMGFLKTANTLQLWKYRSVHGLIGTPPNNAITEMYDGEGLIATDTLKLVDGVPTGLSQRGVVQLKPEGNGYKLDLISEDINGFTGIRDGLTTETITSRGNAFAFIHDKKYWLHVNDKIFILQYNLIHSGNGRTVYPWIKWTTAHNPTCFNVKDGYLYFGGAGNFYKFDPSSVSDDGTAITSYWFSKKMNPGNRYDLIKLFTHLYFEFRTMFGNASVGIEVYINDVLTTIGVADFTLAGVWLPNSFNPNAFVPNTATYTNFAKRIPINIKGKYFQYKIQCDTLNQAFTLLNSKLDYAPDRRVV
jgi:hypothetical protein